jgi:NAD(P)-dependent dehydrogenase (short-subunit alcohol dehydrogenase family)
VKQLKTRGYEIFAGCRNPGDARKLEALVGLERMIAMDVADLQAIGDMARKLQSSINRLDLLINNAGVPGERGSWKKLESESAINTFRVNALGPVLVTRELRNLLGENSRVVNITSRMGSIADNRSGRYYSYRMSKAALNMATRNLALELRSKGVIVVALHPGWVRTRMGSMVAPLSTIKSVKGMIQVLESSTLSDSGKFFDYTGQELPW